MVAIRLPAEITEDRQLIVDLPADLPAGKVEIIIQHKEEKLSIPPELEAARARLAAAGLLGRGYELSTEMNYPTEEEILAAGKGNPDAKPMHEIIDEDRGER